MKKQIVKQKFAPPYNAKGKTNFNIRGRSGCYIITKNEIVRYIGFSGKDVYKAMYRHFEKWHDKRQQRITYDNLKGILVRVIYTNNATNASRLEKALIIKYQPQDNPDKYWLNFQADEKEKQILEVYESENTIDIITGTNGDVLPF